MQNFIKERAILLLDSQAWDGDAAIDKLVKDCVKGYYSEWKGLELVQLTNAIRTLTR